MLIIFFRIVICLSYKCCKGYFIELDVDIECFVGILNIIKGLIFFILKFILVLILQNFIGNLCEKCVDFVVICDGQIISIDVC